MMINTRVKQCCFGPAKESLTLEEVELQPLEAGKIRVQIEATNINPSDLLSIQGVGQYRRVHVPPRVPGFEAVGRIVDIGISDSEFLLGQKVLVAMGGTWQQYVDAAPDNLFLLPPSLDNGYACQLYINALTAWVITQKVAQLSQKDVVIVNAAGSAIGKIYAQLSRSLGFRLIAVTSNPQHYPYQNLAVLNANQDLNSQIQTRGLPTPTVAFDAIGGQAGTALAHTLGRKAQFINYGTLSLTPYDNVFFQCIKQREINFSTFFLRYWEESVGKVVRKEVFAEMLAHFLTQHIALDIERKLPLAKFQSAIESIENPANRRQGKIILTL
ncbi:zinc-dependent alcohol dehydrogenase family protein [Vibrio cidicii]|uniref:zinc-dependent alcohol dehydrogenase family protein n=1 Tax=Vibrio cidicii TaxID=1763883 RepID=UPI000ABAFE76|nr:zinc-dependent alcohol dehydrogenase family protein [Vibrio cidicii]EJN6826537.1 zinc-dependent alcohol dehydrogenase family protein [Vibrio cidicii]ELV8624304.1 zinc-dependent alcohol dehydrogenase family protein [Vibrio cidicii]